MNEIRDYQSKARQWVNQKLNNRRNPLLVMPAGTGKTTTACYVLSDRLLIRERAIVIVGNEEIFNQWIKEFLEHEFSFGYINPEGIIGKNKLVYVAMWKSLHNMLDQLPEKFISFFDTVVIDEAHHAAAKTIETIFDYFHRSKKFGLSATPYREDNKPLGNYFDAMYEPITPKEAIAQNYLVPPAVIVPDQYFDHVPKDLSEIDKAKAMQEVIQHKTIIGDMVKIYRQVFAGAPALIACSGVDHAKEVQKEFADAGFVAENVYGAMSKNSRRDIIDRMRKRKINVLTTYAVGVEGMDIPSIAGIIWLRFTMSINVWIQLNSRAARLFPGKKKYILVDPMGNILVHGGPDLDRQWSLENDYVPGQDIKDNDLSLKICQSCGVANAQSNNYCWVCGQDMRIPVANGKKRTMPKIIDGELVFLDGQDGDSQKNNDNKIFLFDSQQEADRMEKNIQPTKAEKMNILAKDLTGQKINTKFKEGLKWLQK